MARLVRPVMKIRLVMPAATASSTAYWISGLSTMGSISLGLALVAGRKRVPMPATGKTALVIFFIRNPVSVLADECEQSRLVEYGNAEFLGLGEFRAGVRASHDMVCLLRYGTGDLAAVRFDHGLGFVARHRRQRPGQHEGLSGQHCACLPGGCLFGPLHTCCAQRL